MAFVILGGQPSSGLVDCSVGGFSRDHGLFGGWLFSGSWFVLWTALLGLTCSVLAFLLMLTRLVGWLAFPRYAGFIDGWPCSGLLGAFTDRRNVQREQCARWTALLRLA